MSWLTIVQTVSTFITGTFGTTLVIIAVAIAGARAMLHGSWSHFWSAIGGGAVLVCASWVVQTFLGAG
jgi:type IV secretory pathway VirB2 component (pilin)